MSSPYSVGGKVAIVTGAGSGINHEFASLLLKKNCSVIFADLRLRPEAQATLDAHSASGAKPRAVFHKTDVTNWTDLNALFAFAEAEFGGVDIVCPGAGVFEPSYSSFWYPPGAEGSPSTDPTEGFGHYNIMDINVTHPIRMTQLAMSAFLNPAAAGGRAKPTPESPMRILCIASIASEIALPHVPLYISSKWAISGFVRSLASLEQTHNIRINAVAPGAVKTPIWTDQPDKMKYVVEGTDEWVTTAEVAENMVKMLEDPEMVGGTVLEIGHGHTRSIPLMGNTGPSGAGHALSGLAESMGDIIANVSKQGWGKIVGTK